MTWTPSTTDVADILPTRTTNSNGVEVGDFDTTTKPTDTQVDGRIARGMADVQGKAGVIPDPTDFAGDDSYDSYVIVEDLAKTAATYRAAMLVELSYFPEQIETGRSPYNELKILFDEALASLLEALSEVVASGTIEPEDANGSGDPSYTFPEDEGGMVGWGTGW